jgi:hypothetical protein
VYWCSRRKKLKFNYELIRRGGYKPVPWYNYCGTCLFQV